MKQKKQPVYTLPIILFLCLGALTCTVPEEEVQAPTEEYPVKIWITSPDKVNMLYAKSLPFSKGKDDRFPVISVDSSQQFQEVDGFGYTLTGSCAYLINRMGKSEKTALLRELFSKDSDALNISYLRISIGASDLNQSVFSYNDLLPGETDLNLTRFSLAQDTIDLIPLLKEIKSINPSIKLMATPWSAPVWMKDNGRSIGGSLQSNYYDVYARYIIKYIQAMQAQGLHIDAITPQNEPQHGGNNPSMVMSSSQQARFIRDYLGPGFVAAGIKAKIIIWDHNCDNPQFPISILNDPAAKAFIDGSAFHLYAGDIQALSQVHDLHPDRNLYFTEQWTGASGNFGDDLKWHVKHVLIGSMRNWSKIALEWNLANDPVYSLHTPGGCSQCKGALTISGSTITRNVSYYIIAHAARFVPPGSVRIGSNQLTNLPNVAFKTPEGKRVLLLLNEQNTPYTFNIESAAGWVVATINPGNTATIVW